MPKPHTVIVILEAKEGKELELAAALEKVVYLSRSEATCLEYRLHRNLENPTQFILYENWNSKEEHQEQFEKAYVIDLGTQLAELLSKPCQVISAQEMHR